MNDIKQSLRDSKGMRWAMMLLVSFIMAANYYFYDALSPLKATLETELGFSATDFGIVMGFYSFPNVFLLMAILGGIILDKIGIRITGFLFIVFMVIGALLTAYSTTDYYGEGGIGYSFLNSFWTDYSPQLKMMSLGMLCFGLGAETSIVVISKILVKWFKGKEIALAFAINLGIARAGTALAFILSPRLMETNWTTPVWVATMLILISLLGFVIYMMFDLKLDRQIKKDTSLIDPEEEFHLSDLGKLITNRSFLYITALCVTFYAAVFPFLKYAPDFFYNKFGLSPQLSGDISAWLPLGTVIFTPLFGWIVDNKGKSASLMIYGSLILIIVHLAFSLTMFNAYVLVFLLGIAFSLVPSAMWPSVAKIVHENRIGTAYGMMFSLQNLGLFALPIVAGMILDTTNPFVHQEVLLAKSSTEFVEKTSRKTIQLADYTLQKKAFDEDSVALPNEELKIAVRIYADSTLKEDDRVYTEFHHVTTNENGQFTIKIGTGEVSDSEIAFNEIDWNKKPYTIQVKRVLDYTQTILMFSILGFIGLIFAFLLKREDKTSGYGLELPSNETPDEKEE